MELHIIFHWKLIIRWCILCLLYVTSIILTIWRFTFEINSSQFGRRLRWRERRV